MLESFQRRDGKCCAQSLPLYFPGRTLSKVKVMELPLPESWRLLFSPWRLRACKVTSRSPQVSAEETRRVSHGCPHDYTHLNRFLLKTEHLSQRGGLDCEGNTNSGPPEGDAINGSTKDSQREKGEKAVIEYPPYTKHRPGPCKQQ